MKRRTLGRNLEVWLFPGSASYRQLFQRNDIHNDTQRAPLERFLRGVSESQPHEKLQRPPSQVPTAGGERVVSTEDVIELPAQAERQPA